MGKGKILFGSSGPPIERPPYDVEPQVLGKIDASKVYDNLFSLLGGGIETIKQNPLLVVGKYVASRRGGCPRTEFDERLEAMHPKKRLGFLESHYTKTMESSNAKAIHDAVLVLMRWYKRIPQNVDLIPHIGKLITKATAIELGEELKNLRPELFAQAFAEAQADQEAIERIDGIRGGVRDRLKSVFSETEDALGQPLGNIID